MPRAKGGFKTRQRRNRILKLAKGYRGSQSARIRPAMEAVSKAGRHAFADRRKKKGDFRALWIQRINAASRLQGLPYNKLIHGLDKAGVRIDRKVLAELAISDPAAFNRLVAVAKENL